MRATLGVLVVGSVVFGAADAHAGPVARFGLTAGLVDQTAPDDHEIGPNVAVGWRFGALVAEVDYAYLSFLDGYYGPDGVNRVGATLRADVWRERNDACLRNMACTRSSALFVDAGVAERYGQWRRDALTGDTVGYSQHEVHAGIGYELDNKVLPYRIGWQVGLRFAVAPAITADQIACRGVSCGQMGLSTSSGTDKSILLEWTFLVGR